ncbi:hypothetical protein DMI66_09235 [Escherichia coli]|nr:hypothetical protein [Escherichia coli]
MRQPAHNRREDNRCEVLSGVKIDTAVPLSCAGNRAATMRLLPGKMALQQARPEAQCKQGNDNAESTKDIDEALQQGKHRPDKDRPEVDAF